jgi:hypothetical protein
MSTTDRQSFRAALAAIAASAKEKLPECNGRVEMASALVLQNEVTLGPDHTAVVGSQTDPAKTYAIRPGHCDCQDFARAPQGLCKHRLAAAMLRRVQELTPQSPPVETAPAAGPHGLPEAPVSITLKATLHGHEVLVTLRGVDFASVRAQVEEASAWLKAQAPAPPVSPGEGWCQKHGVQMTLNTKDGRSWYSHRKLEGGFCKGR